MFNIDLTNKQKLDKKYISEDVVKKIFSTYEKGIGLWTIEKRFKISRTKLRRLFNQYNKTRRNYVEAESCKIKDYTYHVNEKFFDDSQNWNESQAWTFGWLASDGNNSKNYYSFKISLQERDKYIVETIRKLLDYEGPLRFVVKSTENQQNQWNLTVGNTYMCHQLKKLGILR